MTIAPIPSPDLYPAAFYNVGKTLQDMMVAFAKAKAAPGASTAAEVSAAVMASVPDLVVVLGQMSELGPSFTAAPIGCIQALLNPILDGVKAVIGKQ